MRDATFHNPYTFIWTPPRPVDSPFAGDADPLAEADHSRLHPDRYTGTLRVNLTAKTPLLLVRTPAVEEREDGHKVFDSREEIPVTAFKGMLRSAYEAVTNSRFGVFAGHDAPLGRRQSAGASALTLVPGRIEQRDGNLVLRLLTGTSRPAPPRAFRFKNGQREHVTEGRPVASIKPRTGEVKLARIGYAALLPRYDRSSTARDRGESQAHTYEGTRDLPQHEDPCWVELDTDAFAWKVTRIWKRTVGDDRSPRGARDPFRGWVYRTGPTIASKHQERVFFESGPADYRDLKRGVIEGYESLIRDYWTTHRKDAAERDRARNRMTDYLGQDPGDTAFGPYVYDGSFQKLRPGNLVFVRLQGGEPAALYPCMISRALHPASPKDLLDASLRPAPELSDLSPADRLFGWVRQSSESRGTPGGAAWRGRLRITTTPEAQRLKIEPLATQAEPDGLPLAILGEPKPSQARFYVGERDGKPLAKGISKEEAVYRHGRALRGRKAYWHPAGPPESAEYWRNPLEDRTASGGGSPGYHQEYRRPKDAGGAEQRDSQNRSIRSWIAPGSTATFVLHLTNASLEDIGALLYLASLPADCHLRLGGGKPLGFGSIRLELDHEGAPAVRVAAAESWKTFYRDLAAAEPAWEAAADLADRAKTAFFSAVADAFGSAGDGSASECFARLRFIRDFEAACRGPENGAPVHYPRLTPAPQPEGKNYEWFTENERPENRKPAGHPLPGPTFGDGLPYWPWGVDPEVRKAEEERRSRSRQGGPGGGGGRHRGHGAPLGGTRR